MDRGAWWAIVHGVRQLDRKEGRMPKNWCLWTVGQEKTPESPLDSMEMKPVDLKGNQPWILAQRTDAEAETPVFWSFDMNSWLIGNIPDAGKDWGQKEKRVSEDEIVGWMASLMQWAWIWANFGWWWGTGRPSMLQSMGSQSWTQLDDWTKTNQ